MVVSRRKQSLRVLLLGFKARKRKFNLPFTGGYDEICRSTAYPIPLLLFPPKLEIMILGIFHKIKAWHHFLLRTH